MSLAVRFADGGTSASFGCVISNRLRSLRILWPLPVSTGPKRCSSPFLFSSCTSSSSGSSTPSVMMRKVNAGGRGQQTEFGKSPSPRTPLPCCLRLPTSALSQNLRDEQTASFCASAVGCSIPHLCFSFPARRWFPARAHPTRPFIWCRGGIII